MERNTIAVDESFVVDESYNYEQYYDDGSELMNQGAGTPMGATDANKGNFLYQFVFIYNDFL